ncbi:MAG: carboxymuconolactone decarboxylase family protein [Planctomycetes bacterium]|nr:carboxymuconolactone decarboxylase family protein [Planctomycetota bacterium]
MLAALDAVAADFSTWVLEDAYGRVLARPGLAARQRELLAVAALAALDCPAQLKSHLRGALRLGASRAAVADVLHALGGLLPAEQLARAIEALDRTIP